MSKSKKNFTLISLFVCVLALACSLATFQSKNVFAEETVNKPVVYAEEFSVTNFYADSDNNRSILYLRYGGNETNIGNCISKYSGGWPPFDVTYNDGTKKRTWFGGWPETPEGGFHYSVFKLPLDTSSWKEFTIPAGEFDSVILEGDIVCKRVADTNTWVAGSYKNTDFTVTTAAVDENNNSLFYITRKGKYNLIGDVWGVFEKQAVSFNAKTADGTVKTLTSNYFQIDKTTIYIKFADKALEGCVELTLPEGAYKYADSYRYFGSGFTFYSLHNGCWNPVKGEIAKVDEVPASCETDGVKEYYNCTACGKNFTDVNCTKEIPKLDDWKSDEGKIAAPGHKYGKWEKVVDPTATKKGQIKRVCSANEEHVETFELPELNETDYTYSVITPAACESNGSASYAYTKDNSTLTYEVTLAMTGHTLEAVAGKESNCTEYGYKSYYQCSVCKKAFEDENGETAIADLEAWKQGAGKLTELGGHAYGEWEKVDDPTATRKGQIKRVCSVNADHVETFELPVLNETDYAYSVVTAATCSAEGSAQYVYTKGETNFTYTVVLEKIAHTLEAVAGKASTCTEYGYKSYYQCSACKKAFEDENGETAIADLDAWKNGAGKLTELLAHNYSEEWSSDNDEHWHACKVCGDKKDKAAHADADANGKCDVCGATMKTPDDSGSDSESSVKESGCNSSISGGFTAAIAAVLAAGTFVFVKKGRKED